jgi:transposase-like protein
MTKPIARDPIYQGRRFQPETIELCVRWYLTYRLSYRDLVEMMAERGVSLSHTTIFRWVQRYVPEFEKRWSRYATPVHSSWRMDETAISVRGGPLYLYRAVDKFGKTVDSLLCADRTEAAARAFLCKALKTHQPQRPLKLNLDGNAASHRALRVLRQEHPEWFPWQHFMRGARPQKHPPSRTATVKRAVAAEVAEVQRARPRDDAAVGNLIHKYSARETAGLRGGR